MTDKNIGSALQESTVLNCQIVVPVFNGMDFIHDILANVSFLDVSHEIIVVENGSLDVSLSHLRRVTKRSKHLNCEMNLVELYENDGSCA